MKNLLSSLEYLAIIVTWIAAGFTVIALITYVVILGSRHDSKYPYLQTRTFPDGTVTHCVVTEGSIASGDHWQCGVAVKS